jgi:hypothetical protein
MAAPHESLSTKSCGRGERCHVASAGAHPEIIRAESLAAMAHRLSAHRAPWTLHRGLSSATLPRLGRSGLEEGVRGKHSDGPLSCLLDSLACPGDALIHLPHEIGMERTQLPPPLLIDVSGETRRRPIRAAHTAMPASSEAVCVREDHLQAREENHLLSLLRQGRDLVSYRIGKGVGAKNRSLTPLRFLCFETSRRPCAHSASFEYFAAVPLGLGSAFAFSNGSRALPTGPGGGAS